MEVKLIDPPSRKASIGLFSTWWLMLEADRELAGFPPIDDGELILHFSGSGATCMVFAKDVRAVVALIEAELQRNPQGEGV